jgi:hypothetical protein
VVPDLGYQAGMGRTVGILVKPAMKLGGECEGKCAEPQAKHQPYGRKPAGATLTS